MSTTIEWTDETWNPVTGCTKVSPGCDHCYAITTAHIRSSNPNPKIAAAFAGTTERRDGRIDWTGNVNLLADRLDQPLRWKKPRRIFVNSMSDLFHDAVPDEYIARVFAVMATAYQHTFQVLTKRHARMRALLSSERFVYLFDSEYCRIPDWAERWPDPEFSPGDDHLAGGPLRNVWLGVSVENQQWADIRIPALLDTPAAVRFLSCEPLLGPVVMRPAWLTVQTALTGAAPALDGTGAPWSHAIDWVIVGGESGHGARPMHPHWARALRSQCQASGVPFLFKQWGEYGPAGNWRGPDDVVALDGTRYAPGEPLSGEHGRYPGDLAAMHRWGKKAAGRILDGRTWDEYPERAA